MKMKTLLLIIIFFVGAICFLLFLPGVQKHRAKKIEEINKASIFGRKVRKTQYEGHLYLFIKDGHGVSFVHSPDCECSK